MNQILVEISARHLHLSEQDLKTLFGENAALTPKKDLSQPGQFACEERVTVVGPKKEIKGVSVLGPVRPRTQIEVSLTDARSLGIIPPIRESGDLNGSASCKLVGPVGEVELTEGLVVAKRHIHLDPKTAEQFGLSDKQVVSVKVDTDARSTVFGDVVVRVHPNFAPAMHIDTDEANAAGISGNTMGTIIV